MLDIMDSQMMVELCFLDDGGPCWFNPAFIAESTLLSNIVSKIRMEMIIMKYKFGDHREHRGNELRRVPNSMHSTIRKD